MKIGTFIADKDGTLHGKVYALGLDVTSVMFEPQTSNGGKEYYRLTGDPLHEAYEIGAAFPKEKKGKQYLSVSIDSPALANPINAALFADKGGSYSLIWNRMETQSLKPEPKTSAKPTSGFVGPAVS